MAMEGSFWHFRSLLQLKLQAHRLGKRPWPVAPYSVRVLAGFLDPPVVSGDDVGHVAVLGGEVVHGEPGQLAQLRRQLLLVGRLRRGQTQDGVEPGSLHR